MKVVRVRMRPFAVEEVVEALQSAQFDAMTLSEVGDLSKGVARETSYRGSPGRSVPTMKLELMLAIHDDRVDRALATLEDCHCREALDVVVEEVERAVRIRTGEIDEAAL